MSDDMPLSRSESFVWFEPETVAQLREQLNQAGDGARLEVHKVPHADGHKYWLHVVSAAADQGLTTRIYQPLNKSWVCPPICP